MSSAEDSGMPSASDLITYIGVPLTIIGLLPIAYNAIITLVHLHKVKRDLKRSKINAKVHSDIFNRLVEVEFPKYIIRPPQSRLEINDADNCSIQYSSSASRSNISGGTWTFLDWELQEYGIKTQRTQPGDTLRQPQARVLFWDLISRLYVLGGLPDEKGWRELQSIPFWAEDRRLMILQDIRGSSSLELRVASPKDSDGTISFKLVQNGPLVDWELEHGRRGIFRPGTVALPQAKDKIPGVATILCRITNLGLERTALDPETGDTLDIEHLRIKDGKGCQGIWFASCAAALSVQSQTPILEYRIPADIRQLALTNTIPDGVIKSLYSADTIEVPLWVTARYLSERRHNSDESDGMKSPQSSVPMDDDMRTRRDILEKSRSKINGFIGRIEKALNTPASELSQLETASLAWLRAHGYFSDDVTVEEATREVLARMVSEKMFSGSLCQILERWRGWAGRGAMSVEDFCVVYQAKDIFAQVILVIITLTVFENGAGRTLISMQECAAKGEYIELG